MKTATNGWARYLDYRRLERELERRKAFNASDPDVVEPRSDLRLDLAAALGAVRQAADEELADEEQAAEAAAAAAARERDATGPPRTF
jgi:hypothetical protein